MEKSLLPVHDVPNKRKNVIKRYIIGFGLVITTIVGALFYPRSMQMNIIKTVYYPLLGDSHKILEIHNPNLYKFKIDNLSLTQYYKEYRPDDSIWVPSWTDSTLLDDTKIKSGETREFELVSEVSDIAYLAKLCINNNLYIRYSGEYNWIFGKRKWSTGPFLVECIY